MTSASPDLLAELRWRGLLHQITDETGLTAHLSSGVRRGYVGYDPTADSLTIGNLVTIMMLRHLQEAGHQPVVVMGGGTGMIGDPSGKSAERELQSEERVRANVEAQKKIFAGLLDFSGPRAAVQVNNLDWLGKLGYLQMLRDVGKYFSVNQMIQRDSVKSRLENREQGISYTEFSYMLLQAYDFLHLSREMDVTLQMGGSDQFGNIVSGCDLIRRDREHRALAAGAATGSEVVYPESFGFDSFGLVCPLVTKADGGKFGKTESGAVWLTADRTSPYAYYQFWLNATDADVGKFLRIFTLLREDQILALEAQQQHDPGARPAQRALARAATELLHGATERDRAEAAAAALFSGDLSSLPLNTLNEVLAAAPSSNHPKATLEGEGVAVLDLLAQTSLAASRGQAKQALQENSIAVNGQKVGLSDRVTAKDLLHGQVIALRRGKKNWHVTRWA